MALTEVPSLEFMTLLGRIDIVTTRIYSTTFTKVDSLLVGRAQRQLFVDYYGYLPLEHAGMDIIPHESDDFLGVVIEVKV